MQNSNDHTPFVCPDNTWIITSAIIHDDEPGWINDGVICLAMQSGLNNDYPTQVDTFYASHNFGVMLKGGQSWTSPKVRLRVGQSWSESIMGYRTDNQLDRYPAITAKLGKLYSKVIH